MSKDQIRAAMPTVAALVDEYRTLLADGGKVVFCSENGHVIDRREPEGNVFDIPARYCQPYQPKEKR